MRGLGNKIRVTISMRNYLWKSRKIWLVSIFITWLASPFAVGQNRQAPNIVIILADDLGYGDLSCYNDKLPFKTTHIDALAGRGIRFTDAHSPSSVCSPTRYGLLTGRYAWRGSLKKGVLLPWDPPLIEKSRTTLPQMLKSAGYSSYAVGKWHLGWNWKKIDEKIEIDKYGNNVDFKSRPTGGPLAYGFDYYFGDDVPNYPPYTFFENDSLLAIPTVMKPDSIYGNPGIMAPGWTLEKVMPAITAKAVEIIEKTTKASEKPFFLYFALTSPHTPIAPSGEFKGKSGMGIYGDYLLEVDWSVGKITEALEKQGLTENTLVIFASDNGSPGLDGEGYAGVIGSVISKYQHQTNGSLRGLKGDLWEGGHRIPLIISWPGSFAKKQTRSQPVSLVDIAATLAEITGATMNGQAKDSRSFLTVLNKKTERFDKPLIHHSLSGEFGIRQENWKLILSEKSGGFSDMIHQEGYGIKTAGQLYNLSNDPGEQHNLYAEHPDRVEALTQLLEKIKNP
jgi:arylsulfatase A